MLCSLLGGGGWGRLLVIAKDTPCGPVSRAGQHQAQEESNCCALDVAPVPPETRVSRALSPKPSVRWLMGSC